ncbi:hypothetical protein DES39_0006 [Orbus hercynius]|uniref:Penicillin-binding protein activator LpoA n=1 Tax=Orbus hercynius TaxID=593135 RepID=A0A495RJ38_9GAMM|nr:penicillin-binding protein activator [Orbus hercynius]RKS86808.1 hypothetical protein DES39_0006 [Orbus hercynius]
MIRLHSLDCLADFGKKFFKIAFISILLGLLVGCPAYVSKQLSFDETKGSQYYLSQYSSTSGNEKVDWQLMAIRAYIIEGNAIKAEQLFQQLPTDLNKAQRQEALLLQGELAVINGQSFDLNKLSLSALTDAEKIRYYNIKLGLDGQKHDVNGQIRDYIELQKYGSPEQQHRVINDTWTFLLYLNQTDINSVLVYANESILQGWIDLIYTYRNNINTYTIDDNDDPDTIANKEDAQFNLLKNAVNEWQIQYSNHPAALYLPRNIYGNKYRLPDDTTKKNVALFLPMSGSSKIFGNAIYLGYSDANQLYTQEAQQNITLYDTNSASLDSLVKQAQQQGAELIVGPLLKQDVLTILTLSPSIPVLALNKMDKSDVSAKTSTPICFFALSPEDEAIDAANHIYTQNKKNPLLLVPKNDLGERVANSFAEQWHLNDASSNGIHVQYFESEKALSNKMNAGVGIELEGSLLTSSSPLKNQQDMVNNLLPSDESAVDVISSVNNSGPYDAIYIYASHNELVLIKSMLDMKSNKTQLDENGKVLLDKKGKPIEVAKIIPAIYTSSRSNIEDTTQDYRYDMDRVQFSDIPMILNQNQLIEKLPSYIKNDYSLARLYAMGLDAWQLANRFNQLQSYQIDVLDGMTGKLSTTQGCEINRALPWHQYMNGSDVIVP